MVRFSSDVGRFREENPTILAAESGEWLQDLRRTWTAGCEDIEGNLHVGVSSDRLVSQKCEGYRNTIGGSRELSIQA